MRRALEICLGRLSNLVIYNPELNVAPVGIGVDQAHVNFAADTQTRHGTFDAPLYGRIRNAHPYALVGSARDKSGSLA